MSEEGMETDYESLSTLQPIQRSKRPKSTYGKKNNRNKNNNLSTSRPSMNTSAQYQQENQGSRSNSIAGDKKGLKRSNSDSGVVTKSSKNRRSKKSEEIEIDIESNNSDEGDISSDSDDIQSELIHKRPRAFSNPPIQSTSAQYQPLSRTSSLLKSTNSTAVQEKNRKKSNSENPTPLNDSSRITKKRRIKRKDLDDTNKGFEIEIELDSSSKVKKGKKSKGQEAVVELDEIEREERDNLESMMKYVVMTSEEPDNPTITSQSNLPTQLQPPLITTHSASLSVLGDKSNLPRSIQNEPLQSTSARIQPRPSNTSITTSTHSNVGEAREIKKKLSSSNVLVASSPQRNLTVFRDEGLTPKASTIRRASSLNPTITNTQKINHRTTSINLESLSNALILSTTADSSLTLKRDSLLQVFSPFSTTLSQRATRIERHTSVPVELQVPQTHSSKQQQVQFQRQDLFPLAPATSINRIENQPQPREGSLIPITNNEMDSSMILETFDFDKDFDVEENEIVRKSNLVGDSNEDEEDDLLIPVKEGDKLKESDSSEKIQDVGDREEEMLIDLDELIIPRIEKNREENFPLPVEKLLIDTMEVDIELPAIESEEGLIYDVDRAQDKVLQEDSVSPPPIRHSKFKSTLTKRNSIPSTFSSPQSESNLTFTLPPRTLSHPDPPSTSGCPSENEDNLAYYIRTTSTGEGETSSDDREFDAREMGEGSKPGRTVIDGGQDRRDLRHDRENELREKKKKEGIERLRKQILNEPLAGSEEEDDDDELMITLVGMNRSKS